ncbi:nSTAND1 domain-containing NTPase [Nocardia brasiliensis]
MRETYGSVDTIDLQDLGRDLERRLGDSLVIPRRIGGAELVRDSAPVAAAMPGPLDVVHELKRALDPLTPAERHHFLAKARGTEEGELAWFFEGRTAEIATIVHWLRTERSGMLVVTGIAGSGKSALLGDTVLQSMPDVRDVLVRGGLMDARAPTLLPPDDCFDEVIHLTGLRMEDVVDRVAAAARLGEPPSRSDHSAHPSTARDIEWMVEQLENREESFTLLLDALDEAVGPLTIAATLLRRLAEIPGVRVVVGTRMSTNDSPDYQASDRNLLDAVGCRAPSDGPGPTELHMSHDSVAVAEYAHHKLTRAISVGRLPDTPQTVAAVESIVEQIRGGDHTFLFARLLVHELIGAPSLLDPARSMTTAKLLGGDHRGVFGAAVTRLSAQADCFLPLLQSLALSHGRGIPIRNGVWATMAMAISGGHSGNTPITDEDISSFLRAAEPYVSIDADAGQTVYRLAHRTFVEHFLSSWGS